MEVGDNRCQLCCFAAHKYWHTVKTLERVRIGRWRSENPQTWWNIRRAVTHSHHERNRKGGFVSELLMRRCFRRHDGTPTSTRERAAPTTALPPDRRGYSSAQDLVRYGAKQTEVWREKKELMARPHFTSNRQLVFLSPKLADLGSCRVPQPLARVALTHCDRLGEQAAYVYLSSPKSHP